MVEKRACKTCSKVQPLTREYFGSTPSGGFRGQCRTCMREHVRAYNNASAERKQAAVERAMRRTHFSEADRDKHRTALLRRDGSHCFYCRKALGAAYHVDHKLPLAKGGTDALSNLALACVQCNQEKHNKTVDEYRSWRRRNRLPVLF